VEDGAVDLGIPGLSDAVEVARGGFSTVFRAKQNAMERTVAVKVIHATVVDPVAGEHFLREVRATGRLSQHPNVAPVYDVGTTATGQPYLIMPYYDRGSLEQRLASRGALSEGESVRLARTLATTLEYVHQHGVLHRDIKPANVLLTEFDEPLLADFGVARLVDASVPVHTTGANVVTWAYGPPEAFTGGEPTAAWDIYSLGATVFAMLTGQPPFVDGGDANVFTVLNRIGNVEVPDLRDRGISAPVADAVRQTMAKDPADRPASAADFATMLTRPLPPPRLESVAEPALAAAAAAVAPPAPLDAPVDDVAVPDDEPPHAVPDDDVAVPDEVPPHAVSWDPVPIPATEPRETRSDSALEPAAETEAPAEPAVGPEPAAAGVAGRGRGPGAARGAIVLGVLVGAAALLSFLAIRRNLYEGYGSVLDSSFLADVGAWAPTVALAVGVVLLWRQAGVGAEWIIGAGAAFVLLNYGGVLNFLVREDNPVDSTAMIMRTIAAALVVVAVVLAWRMAEVPGPRISMVMGAVLVAGALAAIIGIRDYGAHVDLSVRSWLIVAMIGVLLVRALALPNRTTGGPALVAGGVVGALAGLESMAREDWDSSTRSSLTMATVGFAVIAVVGVLRWRQSRSPSGHPDEPSAAIRPQ
jgi:Protein kinase domain